MGLFRRGPKRDGRDAPRDPEFSFFSAEEGTRFRAQMREAFAEHGLEVTVYADVVSDSSGRQFGLANLAAVCHNDERGPRAWPELVRQHVGMVLRTMDAPSALDTLPTEQIRAQLYPASSAVTASTRRTSATPAPSPPACTRSSRSTSPRAS